jgi:hypothetical protein
MTEKFIGGVMLETAECCRCGVTFAMPAELVRKRKLDHETFYCPNGHSLHFPAQTEAERLKVELKRTKNLLGIERQCCISARAEANHLEKRFFGMKGHAARLKNQIKNLQGEPCESG